VVISRPGTESDTVLANLGAGRTFGEMSALDGSLTSSTVVAAEDTELFDLPLAAVEGLRVVEPVLWGNLWRNLALDLKERLVRTDELVDHYVDLAQVMSENPSLREQLGLA
jgi:CRP-like cAMP-binding protein